MNQQHPYDPNQKPSYGEADQKIPSVRENETLPWYLPTHAANVLLKQKRSFSKSDCLFAWLSVLLSFLTVHALPIASAPLGCMLTLILLFLMGGAYLVASGRTISLRTVLLFAVGVLFSVSLITNGNSVLHFFVFLFVICFYLCWLYDLGGLAGKKLKNQTLLLQILHAICILPWKLLLTVFPALIACLEKRERDKKLLRGMAYAIAGLAVAVVPTVLIGALLSYDAQFSNLLKQIFSFSLEGLGEWILDLLLCVPVFMLLFSSLRGVREQSETGAQPSLPKTDALHFLPRVLLVFAVTPILILYVLFFVSQWEYYVSAFTHCLPEGLTYADYAREGFFELCTVSGINAAVLWAFQSLMQKVTTGKNTVSRIYAFLLSVFTLILIATALSKMLLYINSYGLTQKRVYAAWFMLLLAFVFLCVGIKQIAQRFPAATVSLVGTVCLFAVITVPNTDAMIARYNVDAYLSGKVATVDVAALTDLGDSAIPDMVRLESQMRKRAELCDGEQAILSQLNTNLDRMTAIRHNGDDKQDGLFAYSVPKARAEKALRERRA